MWQAWARKPLILWLRGKDYKPRDCHTDESTDEDPNPNPALPLPRGAGSHEAADKAERTKLLDVAPNSPNRREKEGPLMTITCPVTMIYGSPGRPPENDWMNCKYGKDLCDQLGREGIDARLYQMKKVGIAYRLQYALMYFISSLSSISLCLHISLSRLC